MRTGKFIEIGHRCREARNHFGYTQDKMHKETGLSASYISDFERGLKRPTSKYLQYLSSEHDISLDYIFSGQGKMKRGIAGFSDNQKINELLSNMMTYPFVYHAIMAFYEKFKMLNVKVFKKPLAAKSPPG